MTYREFIKLTPKLKAVLVNMKGSGDIIIFYEARWNKWDNSLCYFKLSTNGRKTQKGYTLMTAYRLLEQRQLEIV